MNNTQNGINTNDGDLNFGHNHVWLLFLVLVWIYAPFICVAVTAETCVESNTCFKMSQEWIQPMLIWYILSNRLLFYFIYIYLFLSKRPDHGCQMYVLRFFWSLSPACLSVNPWLPTIFVIILFNKFGPLLLEHVFLLQVFLHLGLYLWHSLSLHLFLYLLFLLFVFLP